MKLAAVITAFNEGDEVQKTVESLAGSVKDPEMKVRGVLVDDGSKDGSCASSISAYPSLISIPHDQSQGVGRSRNDGVLAALDWGADVVSFHDGHMRFTPFENPPLRGDVEGAGVLEALARKAIESGAIVCSKAKGWWYGEDHPEVKAGRKKAGEEHSFVAWGADMHWNIKNGLQPKYRVYLPEEKPEWMRVPCPMGACYVMSRETIEKLMAPTGRLWDDVAGRWGFSEQALAVKAFLLDIPILVSRDLQTHHLYRSKNPVPHAAEEVWKNCCFSMAALLSKETFDRRFRRYCEIRLGKNETDTIYKEARKTGGEEQTTEKERRIFTDLCGRGAPITAPHPDHAWLDGLAEHCASTTLTPQAPPLRILQWRPGESTLLLASWFPNSQIRCLEWEKHRASNWGPILKDLPNVNLLRVPLASWADPTSSKHIKPDERFDLITIGGEMQDECRAVAEGLLAPGGRIIVNPTADRLQVEDAERRRAAEELAAFQQQNKPQSAQRAQRTEKDGANGNKILDLPSSATSASSAVRKPSVTVLLLNWQRPENIGPILGCLAAQTARPKIVLWNNGDPISVSSDKGPPMPLERHQLVSHVVRSSKNLGCMPRWWLAAQADTEFVCSLDDDLLLADPRVLEDAMEAQRTLCPNGIVGFFGWEPVPGKSYKDARHINGAADGKDRRVDLIKGRFMVFQTRLLQRVLLAHPALTGQADMLRRCDDVYLNFSIGQGERAAHLVPGALGKRWKEIRDEQGRGLESQPGHWEERDRMVRLMMDHYWGEPRKGA